MSYRYNIIDIIVSVGMCAIVFGAVLFFIAATGTLQTATPQPISIQQPTDSEFGMTWVQPALGQAIVDQAIFERRANQVMAQSASEWNQATLAHHELQSLPGGPFGAIMHQAATVPADHMARVQGVMGRAIVNFTTRGIRGGILSAGQELSDYNISMIRTTEAMGQRLEREFTSMWQTTLGRGIMEAAQNYTERASTIQERVGTALLHMVWAQTGSEEVRAAQQEQLASLVIAAVRTEELADRLQLLEAIKSSSDEAPIVSTEPTFWPEMPIGYVIVANLLLAAIFFGGLSLITRHRESKALAEMRHDADRWVYRMTA